MGTEILYNLLEEKIKQNLPSSLEQKLLSYQDNRNKWLYYGVLINQEQSELIVLDLKACQGCYSLQDIESRIHHNCLLKEYQDIQFDHFRSMCCDALDVVNELCCN
jgi:hypothetical protein